MSNIAKGFIILAVAVVFIIGAAFSLQVFSFVKEIKHNAPLSFSYEPPSKQYKVPEVYNSPWIGAKKPILDISMFCDFQCPFCKQANPIIREFVAKNSSAVRLVFRYFPNDDDHPGAQLAASAASCAEDQGKFWYMHDKLFQNTAVLTPSLALAYARQVGLDETLFKRCLTEHKNEQKIKQDMALAFELGIEGTPTFFINGKKAAGVIPLESLEKILKLVAHQ